LGKVSKIYNILCIQFLHTRQDAQINVGWGSKQTQFHGSLGKSAAQAPPTSLDNIGSSPDDDSIPRLSWRGDGAFFAVSCLSPENVNTPHRRRVIRVYNREVTLQSTSEPVAGLEHVLSWRPSGNMIVSTQRFGFDGGGVGKDGRHDIVIFERNGLRHGEFGLRQTAVDKGESYKVKELNWSSDSNVLAVWIEHRERDVGEYSFYKGKERMNFETVQLWTTANYHW
jgi:elongator complex protein 1